MRDARAIIMRLRRTSRGMMSEEQTTYMLAVLRAICPFIFEELLLHCLEDLGFGVKRSRYTFDGGIDGIVWDDDERKILLQAKRYSGEINPQHVLDFSDVICQDEEAVGGLLIHTGITCIRSQELREHFSHLDIVEGCGLRELVIQ